MRSFPKTKCVFLKQKRNATKIANKHKKASVFRCPFSYTFSSNFTFSSPASSWRVRSKLVSYI